MKNNYLKFLREQIKSSPPAFHYWDEKPQTGGFSEDHFLFLEEKILTWNRDKNIRNPRIVETGAGLSTLLFLSMGLDVVSFSLPEVLDRISEFLKDKKTEIHWEPVSGFGEYTVPTYFKNLPAHHDFALIDGNHAIPSVFSDFIHLAGNLNKSGLIFIDDTQLPGPGGLCRFIEMFPDRWRFVEKINKLSCYEKLSDFGIDCGNHIEIDIFR